MRAPLKRAATHHSNLYGHFLYGCQFPGTSPDHPGISPAGRERYQKRSGISPRPLCPRPPDGDIPGRRGHPGPRWGYPRPLRDIPGRVGVVLDERGHPRPLARGITDRLGDIPGPSGDVPPASWSLVPHTQPTRACHITRSKPTQRHVTRCLCDTTRPSEGSCCAAVAAAHAQPSCPGARRGPASHTARRGEASGGQSRPQTTVCAAVWRALFETEQTSRRGPDSARSEGCGRPPSRRACGTGRSVAEACASKEPRPGAVESWSRARRRQPARAHAGCREPPSLAAQERG